MRFNTARLGLHRRGQEFAWDDERLFAWGTHLYPDWRVIPYKLRSSASYETDPRLDMVSIAPERDILPSSSGD